MENYALKVKEYSLGQEIRYIRKQENRARDAARYHRAVQEEAEALVFASGRHSLNMHRLTLRRKARATHLARAFLDGTPYSVVENENTNKDQLMQVVDEIVGDIARYRANPFGLPHGYPTREPAEAIKSSILKWIEGVE